MSGLIDRLRLLRRRGSTPALEERCAAFREVLHANNQALGAIAAIQGMLALERPATGRDVTRFVTAATVQTYRMISGLNRMTAGRFEVLLPRFEALKSRLAQVAMTPYLGELGFVVPLAEARSSMAQAIGEKSAFLAEARRLLPRNVPDGFAVTVAAYREFLAASGLGERIAAVMTGLDGSPAACFSGSARIAQLIECAAVPAAVRDAIESAATAGARYAVRSSALGEGGLTTSFAGQYRSLLNVPAGGVVEAFRSVVAGKYSPQAIAYQRECGLREDEVVMCCCVLRMVDAAAAGVLYSHWKQGDEVLTLVQAVHGLGLCAVDGSAVPDSVLIDPERRRVVSHRDGQQSTLLRCALPEGTERAPVALAGGAIAPEQALQLADLARRLSDEWGTALDLEWAIDGRGWPWILQARPRPRPAGEVPARPRVAGAAVLLEGGSRASGGAGCGRVHRVETDLDILRCPPGAVIVTTAAHPRLAVLLPRAAALVADMGEATSHLAAVARELHVPALLATRHATGVLAREQLVTVDADARAVYQGRVETVLQDAAAPAREGPRPHLERLAAVAPDIVPLTLAGRLAGGHSPKKCRTLHDIVRFCHQATVEAMFDLGDRALRDGAPVHRLVSEVPIDCRLIDLGGGLRVGTAGEEITIDAVACLPLRALYRGLLDPRLRRRLTRSPSLRGVVAAAVHYSFDLDGRVRGMGEPSYAFVSADYLNLNSRYGYHFETVDARIGPEVESNYASFRFVGGSTAIAQRSRRAEIVARVLASKGFETDCQADLVNARLRGRPPADLEDALQMLGLLTGYVNHLDMALVSEELVPLYERHFLAGDFDFQHDDA